MDVAFARERIQAYKTMYANLEVVGWYAVDESRQDEPSQMYAELHAKTIS